MLFNYFVAFLALLFAILPNWIHEIFGELTTAEQIVFHILSGISGLEGSDNTIEVSFVLYVLLLPLCLVIAFAFIFKIYRFPRLKALLQKLHLQHILLYLSQSKIFYVFILILSLAYCGKSLHIKAYLSSFKGPDTFSELYVPPNSLKLNETGNQKNLILIYFESLENYRLLLLFDCHFPIRWEIHTH